MPEEGTESMENTEGRAASEGNGRVWYVKVVFGGGHEGMWFFADEPHIAVGEGMMCAQGKGEDGVLEVVYFAVENLRSLYVYSMAQEEDEEDEEEDKPNG